MSIRFSAAVSRFRNINVRVLFSIGIFRNISSESHLADGTNIFMLIQPACRLWTQLNDGDRDDRFVRFQKYSGAWSQADTSSSRISGNKRMTSGQIAPISHPTWFSASLSGFRHSRVLDVKSLWGDWSGLCGWGRRTRWKSCASLRYYGGENTHTCTTDVLSVCGRASKSSSKRAYIFCP